MIYRLFVHYRQVKSLMPDTSELLEVTLDDTCDGHKDLKSEDWKGTWWKQIGTQALAILKIVAEETIKKEIRLVSVIETITEKEAKFVFYFEA